MDATTLFAERIEAARQHLARLQEVIDSHMGIDPDRVNWANAGDAGRLESALAELCEAFAH